MKILSGFVSIVVINILLQGCSVFYFGYTKAEWDKLSPAERIAAQDEYKAIISTQNERQHDEKINARTQSIVDYGTKKSDQ